MEIKREDLEVKKHKEMERRISEVLETHGYIVYWGIFGSIRRKGLFGKKVATLSTAFDDIDLEVWMKTPVYENEKELLVALKALEDEGLNIKVKVESEGGEEPYY